MIKTALQYLEYNLSVIGIDHEGNSSPQSAKRPFYNWKPFQTKPPTREEVYHNFQSAKKIGIVCGIASGNLEVIDVDDSSLYDDLYQQLLEHFDYQSKNIFTVKTNKGYHIYYRNEFDMMNPPEDITNCGNQPLARQAKDNDGLCSVRIETRGQGGYVVAPPSKGYSLTNDASFENIPTWSIADREAVFAICRTYNLDFQHQKNFKQEKSNYEYKNTPWDEYNNDNSNPWIELLEERGWSIINIKDPNRIYFKRPGDTETEQSGNFHLTKRIFWLWTTSSELEPMKAFTPAILRCRLIYGDLTKESLQQNLKDLLELGYGQKWNKVEKGVLNKATDIVKANQGLSTSELLKLMKTDISKFHLIEEAPVVEIAKKKLKESQVKHEISSSQKVNSIVDYFKDNEIVRNNVTMQLEDKDGDAYDEIQMNTTYLKISEYTKMSKDFFSTVIYSNFVPSYNPFEEFFDNLEPIEGEDYIEKLLDCLNLKLSIHEKNIEFEGDTYTMIERNIVKSLFTKWLLQFFASVYETAELDLMLILTGSKNSGKTYFFKHLLPEALKKEYVNIIHDFPKKEEDAYMILTGSLLTVRDDMKKTGNKDVAWLKQLMSAETLTFRAPYGKSTVKHRRHAVIAATSNDEQVIAYDDSNRRFFPLKITSSTNRELYAEVIKDERMRLWRQLKYKWESFGESKEEKRAGYAITRKEIAYLSNLDDMTENDNREMLEELVYKYIVKPKKVHDFWLIMDDHGIEQHVMKRPILTTTEIRNYILENEPYVKDIPINMLGSVMTRGFEKGAKKVNGRSLRGYEAYKLPPDKIKYDVQENDADKGYVEPGEDDLPF